MNKTKPAKTIKPTKAKDKFTPTEVGSLIEQFRGEFRVFGEDLSTVNSKLDATYEQVGKNTAAITTLEIAVKSVSHDLAELKAVVKDLTGKIEALTNKVDKNTEAITALVKSIDNLAKVKIDREEFHTLERRITQLEAKVAGLAK